VKKISSSEKNRTFRIPAVLAGWNRSSAMHNIGKQHGLGESRAGKPANSPAGAISRRRGPFKRPAPFFIERPTQAVALARLSLSSMIAPLQP
jgi:hypothetical protein